MNQKLWTIALNLLLGLQNSKNVLAQSSQVSATTTSLIATILSMKQSDFSFGTSDKSLDLLYQVVK